VSAEGEYKAGYASSRGAAPLVTNSPHGGRCKPTDDIVARLCAGGPAGSTWRELRHINLKGCCRKRIGPNAVGLTDATLASLAAGCPALHRLELSDVKTKESFSVEALLELVDACPLTVRVSRCSHM
jgi:hypothetical protein